MCVCARVCVCVCVSPTPRVTWSRLDTSMPVKNSNASFGQELVINAAEFSDSGRYQCTAVNTASARPRAVVDFTLTVECTSTQYLLPELRSGPRLSHTALGTCVIGPIPLGHNGPLLSLIHISEPTRPY